MKKENKVFTKTIAIVAVIALIFFIVSLFVLTKSGFLNVNNEFITSYGYTGVFIVELLFTSSVLVPLMADPMIAMAAVFLDPLKLGLITGIAAAIGESTAYLVGKSGGTFITHEKLKKQLDKTKRVFDKYGFIMLPVFAFTPLPCDLIGIVSGMTGYKFKKFFIGMLLGKIPRTILVAFTGKIGYDLFF